MNGYEITGALARAFERHNEEDIAELKKPKTIYYLYNIMNFTQYDKYFIWANKALQMYHNDFGGIKICK